MVVVVAVFTIPHNLDTEKFSSTEFAQLTCAPSHNFAQINVLEIRLAKANKQVLGGAVVNAGKA